MRRASLHEIRPPEPVDPNRQARQEYEDAVQAAKRSAMAGVRRRIYGQAS